MRHEFLDDHGFDRSRAIFPIDVHAFDEPIDENDETRRSLPRFDGSIKVSCNFRETRESTARAMQPIDNRQSPLPFAIVCCWRVDVVTDFALGSVAIKSMKRHSWSFYLGCHPRFSRLRLDSLRR